MKRLMCFAVPVLCGVILTAVVGRIFLADGAGSAAPGADGPAVTAQVWTCSMHPQIRMDHQDICPLCGMDLTPVDASQDPWEAESPGVRLVMNQSGRQMARVETTEVLERALTKDLRTVGRVEFDETRMAYIASRIDGRVDQVFADFPGTGVRHGEHLVKIYSPELLSTQQEFLTALRAERAAGRQPGSDLAGAARRRLLLWGITADQIDALAQSGQAQDHLVVYAPIGGTVIDKNIRPGQYVKEGDALYTIADLTRVWLVLEVYESELSWVRVGQSVEVTLESNPHEPLTGAVAFIEPVLDSASRTVRVRVVVENPDGRLKPGMYAQALVRVPILPDGQPAATGLEGKYVCPMHPYEVSDEPAACGQCGMPLERVPVAPAPAESPHAPDTAPSALVATDGAQQPPQVLAVPAEAILTTGQRQLVYVERAPGKYELVEPKLGPRAGDYYPVLDGLNEHDRVVTRGNFLLDSQYQITGRTSLLYPGGSSGEFAAPDPVTGFTPQEQASIDELSPEDRLLAMRQRICPISDQRLGSMGKPVKMDVQGTPLFLCCKGCEGAVQENPAAALEKARSAAQNAANTDNAANAAGPANKAPEAVVFTAEELANLNQLADGDRELARQQQICPITGMHLGSMGPPYKLTLAGRTLFLCCRGCEGKAKADPEAAFRKLPAAAAGSVPAASAPAGPGGHGG